MESRMTFPMTMNADDLLDRDKMLNGPMVVMWGQEDYIPVRDPQRFKLEPPKRRLIERLSRRKPWRIMVRLQPPEGEDLELFGRKIAASLGIEGKWDSRDPSDKAVWLPASGWYPNAPAAIGAAGRVLNRLSDLPVAAVQVEVQVFPPPTPRDQAE